MKRSFIFESSWKRTLLSQTVEDLMQLGSELDVTEGKNVSNPKIDPKFVQKILTAALVVSGRFRISQVNSGLADDILKDPVDTYLTSSGELGFQDALVVLLTYLTDRNCSDFLDEFSEFVPFSSQTADFFPTPTKKLLHDYNACLENKVVLSSKICSYPHRFSKEKRAGLLGLLSEVNSFLEEAEEDEEELLSDENEEEDQEEDEEDEKDEAGNEVEDEKEEVESEVEDEKKHHEKEEKKETKLQSKAKARGPTNKRKRSFISRSTRRKHHPQMEPYSKQRKTTESSSTSHDDIPENPYSHYFEFLNSMPNQRGYQSSLHQEQAEYVLSFFAPAINNLPFDTEFPGEKFSLKSLALYLMAGWLRKGYSLRDSSYFAAIDLPFSRRTIQTWYHDFLVNNLEFKCSLRGKHPKIKSLLDNVEIFMRCKSYVEANIKTKPPITAGSFQRWVNATFVEELGVDELGKPHAISLSTANRFLHRLGFYYSGFDKGIVSSHERPDVVEHRIWYIKQLAEYRKNVLTPDKLKNMSQKEKDELAATKDKTKKPVIIVYGDESVFHSFDVQKKRWKSSKFSFLKPTYEGRALHVSCYVNSLEGVTKADDGTPLYEIRQLGSQGEGFWKSKDVLAHAEEVVETLKARFPFCHIVMVVDNSPCHRSHDKDSLRVEHLNKHQGGKQPILKDSEIEVFREFTQIRAGMDWDQAVKDGRYIDHKIMPGFTQAMNDVIKKRSRSPQQIIPKGLVRILKERMEKVGVHFNLESLNIKDLRQYLKHQPDFENITTQLEDVISSASSTCIYLPRFHPELNIIEYWWGLLKHYTQARNTGKLDDLKKILEDAISKYDRPELMNDIESLVKKYEKCYAEGILPLANSSKDSDHHATVSPRDVKALYDKYFQVVEQQQKRSK